MKSLVEDILNEVVDMVSSDLNIVSASTADDNVGCSIQVDELMCIDSQGESGEVHSSEEEEEEDWVLRLKARDEWIASVQAEFHRQFPSFTSELQEFKATRKPRKQAKRKEVPADAPRKSIRLQERSYLPVEAQEENCEVGESGDCFQGGLSTTDVGDQSVGVEEGIQESSCSLDTEISLCNEGTVDQLLLSKHACLPCEMSFRYVN